MQDRIELMRDDPAVDLTVDGNAVAGVLAAAFGAEMTAAPGRCAHCHTVSLMGSMRVYMRGPGIVIRCPACAEVVVRIVQTDRATMVDARGAAYIAVARQEPTGT
jgi:uncharacterized protein DUF6510